MSILSKLNILNLRYKNFLLTPISWFGLTLPPSFSLSHFRKRPPTESIPVVFTLHNIPCRHEPVTD